MEHYIETRFGDPTVSVSLRGSQLVYGSALGRIGFFNILTREHTLLTQLAEEAILGIYLADDRCFYAAVGDMYMLKFIGSDDDLWQMESIYHEDRVHKFSVCNYTHVLQDASAFCLVLESNEHPNEPGCLITDAYSEETTDTLSFRLEERAMPVAFTSGKLLWLSTTMPYMLKQVTLATLEQKVLRQFQQPPAHCCVLDNLLYYVEDFRTVKVTGLEPACAAVVIGQTATDIVALCAVFKDLGRPSVADDSNTNLCHEQTCVITVETAGVVTLWSSGTVHELIRIAEVVNIDDPERLFALGYPYRVVANNDYIAVTTDLGLFVLRSSVNTVIPKTDQ